MSTHPDLCPLSSFRWSGGAVRGSTAAQSLQYRLHRLRQRRDSGRRGAASGGGRLKYSQNITLFCQIIWQRAPPNTMSTAVIIFLFFVYFSFAFYIGNKKLHCFNYTFVCLVYFTPSPVFASNPQSCSHSANMVSKD